MDTFLRGLEIVATSWPLAFIAVGITVAVCVNRRFKQGMDDNERARVDRASGNQAVVVRGREDG